ncbi:MAG: hypothetical protein ABIG44_12625 [Planctomycetota bacterium]
MAGIMAPNQPDDEARPADTDPSTEDLIPAAITAPRPAIVDVWSRTEPKYRIRAILLLLLNLVLFCGLCIFTHWLHFGRAFDFSRDGYLAPMKFWGEQTQNLNDFVLYPISVEQTPMHGVVLGLLVASIVAVPISVAILYRFPYALPFAAAVLVFAHMPWMALTLVGCCILAAVKPFRLSFRFGAALVGMLPVILYLYLATRGMPHQIGTYAYPSQKLLLAAPWILALIAASAMLGTILAISRIVNYRPGAVAPVMAIMFATPAILFKFGVGVDEVHYRILEAEYGPRAARFVTRDVSDRLLDMLRARMDDPAHRTEMLSVFAGRVEPLLAQHERLTHELWCEFLADRRDAYEACRDFIADHPNSRYIPSVLCIQGRVLDLRLDARKSLPLNAPPRREIYSDYPHVQSQETWLALLSGHSDSTFAVAARLRLAQLALRRGEVAPALNFLAELEALPTTEYAATQAATQPANRGWLRGALPETSLAFEPEPYMREARRLRELILANRNDPHYGQAPLRELANLDPHRPTYREQLLRLADRYRDSLLYDNLVVHWAAGLGERDDRAAALGACIRDFPDGDALAEAMFRLAELEIQNRGPDQETRRQAGIARMRELVSRFADTHWGSLAVERLHILQPREDNTPKSPVLP